MSQDPKRPLPPPAAPHRPPAPDAGEAQARPGDEMLGRGVGLSATGELEGAEALDTPGASPGHGRTRAGYGGPGDARSGGPPRLSELRGDASLELAERPARPPVGDSSFAPPPVEGHAPVFTPAPPPRRGWAGRLLRGLALAALVSALAGAAVLWKLGGLPAPQPRSAPPAEGAPRTEYALQGTQGMAAPVLLVSSEPSGATVRVDGVVKGTTPLALDNHYAPGREVRVELTLRGHRPWSGTFRGGEAATLDAQLRRR